MLPMLPGGAAFGLVLVAGGLWIGGGFALERADPLLVIPSALAVAVVFAAWHLRRGGGFGWPWLVAGLTGTGLMMALLAALTVGKLGLPPEAHWSAALLLIATALALVLAGWMTRRTAALRPGLRWGIAIGAALAWWFAGHLLAAQSARGLPTAAAGRVVLLTGLPLVQWAAADGPRAREDPALDQLRQRVGRPVVLRDALAADELRPGDRLLLAHPRALPAATLVEIDRFVRAGGRAVVLADGLSAWPPPHPLGDPRNPPITSLLTPLLSHWGIVLAAPPPASASAGPVEITAAGRLLALHSPGHFDRLPPACAVLASVMGTGPVLVRCRVDRGEAVLLSDADLLFAPLWQADPAWAHHLRASDNMDWLIETLSSGDGAPPQGN